MKAKSVPNSNPIKLTQVIENDLSELTPKFRKLAEYILNNTFAVSSMNIAKLAKSAGVSNATVNRLAHHFGFKGYPEFRAKLRDGYNAYFSSAYKLEAALNEVNGFTSSDIFEKSIDCIVNNIQKSKHELMDKDLISKAASMILDANYLYFVGIGSGRNAVHIAINYLRTIMYEKVGTFSDLYGIDGSLRDRAAFPENTLIIAFSFPLYADSIRRFILDAKKDSHKVLGITDKVSSPIFQISDLTLLTPVEHPILPESVTPIYALIEAICAIIYMNVKDSKKALEKQTEGILPLVYTS